MGSIIDLNYYCDGFRTTNNSRLGDEYKSAVDRVCEAEKQLFIRFHECAEVYEECQDAQITVTSLAQRFEFAKGMRVGDN